MGKILKSAGNIIGTVADGTFSIAGEAVGFIADKCGSEDVAKTSRDIGHTVGSVSKKGISMIGNGVGTVVSKIEDTTINSGGNIAAFTAEKLGADEKQIEMAKICGQLVTGIGVGVLTGNVIGTAMTANAVANGVASTGTAISSLHGGAQTLATLANIGGDVATGQAILTGVNVATAAGEVASVAHDEKLINFNLKKRIAELENYNREMEKIYNAIKNAETSKYLYDPNELKEEIYSIIQSAEHFMYIAIYDISEYTILDKLIEKSNNGVNIKILTDSKRIDDITNNDTKKYYSPKTINKILNCFNQKNIDVKKWGREEKGIMHRKEIIVDNKRLILGSANLTLSGTANNKESIVSTSDINMIQQASNCFINLYNSNEAEAFDKN